jgi:hypothetical protein
VARSDDMDDLDVAADVAPGEHRSEPDRWLLRPPIRYEERPGSNPGAPIAWDPRFGAGRRFGADPM